MIEIKQAIEKLKGYRIECQSLMLFDEIELINGKNEQIKNLILQPLVTDLKQKKEQLKELPEDKILELASKEATNAYLRLKDDQSLQQYDVLQEYPHTHKWRQI